MGTAAGITGKVEGLNKTLTALQRLGVEAADIKDVMSGIAAEAARLATGYAPARSGRLRRTVRPNRAKAKAIVLIGRARVPYAGPINYGWRARNIAPANFIKRTDTAMGTRAVSMLEDGLNDLIRETGLD